MSAPVGLEYKTVAALDPVAPPDQGIIEALVAVTGVRDDVGDIIVPGAFTKTLVSRKPKVCLGHDWNRPIGKTLDIKELMPGDPDLPKTTADGKPWPKEAGAVWARFQANMAIDDGKNAFQSAKFYGPESTYSIGYKATSAKHRGNTRYINELDLFEFGPVLHPANRLATLQSIKAGGPEEIEYTDLDVVDEEKTFTVEELTLRDYAAILDIMEEKAATIRRVSATGADYWGMPVGTIIRPGMKPQGTGKGKTSNRGLTTAKPANAPKARAVAVDGYAVTRDGYAGKVTEINGDAITLRKIGEAPKTFSRSDVSAGEATPDAPLPVKLTGAQRDAATLAFQDSDYSDEELGARLKGDTLEILDIGRAVDALDAELEVMEDNPDRKRSAGRPTKALRDKIAKMATFDDAPQQEQPEADKPEADAKPDADKPAETEQSVRAVAEELGMEMRPNPAPPEFIVNPPKGSLGASRVMSFESDTGRARASNGQVIPAGRVEEFLRTWKQEQDKSKDGHPPRADWVLDQMDAPAREAAAKKESVAKKRKLLADATDEQVEGQAQFEVDRLVKLDKLVASGRGTPESQEKAREYGKNNLALVNEELTKRGLPPHLYEPGVVDNPALAEFGPEVPGLSTKPTGGRPIEEILASLPITKETQNVRWRLAHGADVLDDPSGSGIFAVGPVEGYKEWTVTVGAGYSIPAAAVIRTQTNENGTAPTNPKNVTAWLKAMGELRDADGNPPPYGTATAEELIAWQDADGRRLAKALEEVTVPAYLAAIGKKGGHTDKTKAANWRSNPRGAALKLPPPMAAEFGKLGQNAKQAYILRRSEGDDHAAALESAREMIANAQRVSSEAAAARDNQPGRGPDLPTGPSSPPAVDSAPIQPLPPGEISTDGLLMLNRVTGPAAIAAMDTPELERHDAELTRRATELGKRGQVSPAHQAIKDALRAKQDQQRREDRAAAEAAESPEQQRKRQIEEAPSSVSDARRLGRMTRGEIALREANKEIPLDNVSGNAYNVMRGPDGVDGARQDGVASAELARGIASDAEFLARADTADQVADLIDSWGVDLGEESDLPARLRAWGEGVRSVLNTKQEQGDPAIAGILERLAGQTDDPDQARRSGIPTRGFLAFRLAQERLGMDVNPMAYATFDRDATPEATREAARVSARERFSDQGIEWRAEQVERALNEIDSWNADLGRDQGVIDNIRAWVGGTREGLAERPDKRTVPEQPSRPAAPRASQVVEAVPEPSATISPEQLDEAAESEAASVGLAETPDGALEVDPEVADRQDRVEKLIKDADNGKLDLSTQSTEDLTATRQDLVDELRLQTVIQRRQPRSARPANDAPKTRPGLAGAAEDHAEALRSGDAAAIERTRVRLESSIRRSRADSEIARSLADSVTGPSDNDAEQLSDLAKRLRAESRERRNATARKRRTAKRIERQRLQSLLGAVDNELRGRGVELEQVRPELLAPDADSDGRPNLSAKQKAVLLTANQDGWVAGHGTTTNSLVANNLATWPGREEIPPSVRQQGSSWVRLNENGMAELALLRGGVELEQLPKG